MKYRRGFATLSLFLTAQAAIAADAPRGEVVLAKEGQALAAIYAPAEVVHAKDVKRAGSMVLDVRPESQRERLRNSIQDLAHYLGKIAGTTFELVDHAPEAADKRVPILVGDLAAKKFGPPGKHTAFKQGLRLVVSPEGIGLIGESDLATSYAIYELLHRLGCR